MGNVRMSDGRKVLVYFPGSRMSAVAGTDVQLATELAKNVDLVVVEPPLSVLEAIRKEGLLTVRRPVRVSTGPGRLTRVEVIGPFGPSRVVLRRLASGLQRTLSRRVLRRLGLKPWVVIASCPSPQFRSFPGTPYVYFATDDFVAGSELMRVSRSLLRKYQANQVDHSDLVVAVSRELATRLLPDSPVLVLPNAVDLEFARAVDSAPPAEDVRLPRPIAGVVGQLSARIDLGLLEGVADSGMSLLLVGPIDPGLDRERVARLVRRANVQAVGHRDRESLAGYYKWMDVGITPYRVDRFNTASSPLKTLEYLACGIPVVSTSLPSLEELVSRHVLVADTPVEFANAAWRALELRVDDRTFDEETARFREAESWEARSKLLLGALERL